MGEINLFDRKRSSTENIVFADASAFSPCFNNNPQQQIEEDEFPHFHYFKSFFSTERNKYESFESSKVGVSIS